MSERTSYYDKLEVVCNQRAHTEGTLAKVPNYMRLIMNRIFEECSHNEDEEFVSLKDHGSNSSSYVYSQFDYVTKGELTKRRNLEAKKQAIAKFENLGYITLTMVIDHYGYESKQRICFELFGRDRIRATDLKGQAYELLQELALLRVEELMQVQARAFNMPKVVEGFRKTTTSKEFDKLIAKKIKEGKFPAALIERRTVDFSGRPTASRCSSDAGTLLCPKPRHDIPHPMSNYPLNYEGKK